MSGTELQDHSNQSVAVSERLKGAYQFNPHVQTAYSSRMANVTPDLFKAEGLPSAPSLNLVLVPWIWK